MFLNRFLMVPAGSPHHVQSDAGIQDEGELKMSTKCKIRDGGQAIATPERSFKRR
jgi:hypothetical protein